RPVATAAAEPLDDPPIIRDGSVGFNTSPNHGFSPVAPAANSSRFVFPTTMTRPDAFNAATTGASIVAGATDSREREPAVDTMPAISMLSLTASRYLPPASCPT